MIYKYAQEGNCEDLKVEIEKEPGIINKPDSEQGLTLLHYAASRGKVDIVKFLILKGSNIDTLSSGDTASGSTPLMLATQDGHIDVVKCLIENHADVNAQDKFGNTPLHWAAGSLFFQEKVTIAAQLLIDKGANPAAVNLNGQTPLDKAKAINNEPMIHLLK